MGLIKIIGIIFLITFLIGGIAGGYTYYKLKDINKIKIEDSKIQVINATSDSFTIEGYIIINNPSNTAIPLQTINYQMILEKTGEIMAEGEIPTSEISKQNTTRLEFGQTITIPPSAKELTQEPNIYATIEAKIILDYPIIRNFPIPFEQQLDIKPQIQQMIILEMINLS